MADATAIQWTDSTWNVVTGCTRVSPGCAHCYIERTPPFRMQGRRFEQLTDYVPGAGLQRPESTTGVRLHWDRLEKVPRGPKVFTPSLGDLFHEDVPDEFIAAVFDAFARHPDRIFQVLTKRPERAREVIVDLYDCGHDYGGSCGPGCRQPLPNVWLGVSIENARFTWRADVLRQIPAAVRFISAEPLLGSLFEPAPVRVLHAAQWTRIKGVPQRKPLDLTGIDWIIIGGESGPGARPMRLEWAREIIREADRENLRRSGPDTPIERRLATFVKQLGAKPRYFDYTEQIGRGIEKPLVLRDRKGGSPGEWPADLRIREFPRSGARLPEPGHRPRTAHTTPHTVATAETEGS